MSVTPQREKGEVKVKIGGYDILGTPDTNFTTTNFTQNVDDTETFETDWKPYKKHVAHRDPHLGQNHTI